MATKEAHAVITDNLWGDLPDAEEGPTPRGILRQQADILTGQTRGMLSGAVETTVVEGNVQVKLLLVAPYLGNYEVEIVTVRYSGVSVFPLDVFSSAKGRNYTCWDIEEFKAHLSEILQSTQVREAVAALLTQSQA